MPSPIASLRAICSVTSTAAESSNAVVAAAGGGASLELLEGKVLPGVAALDEK